MNKKIIWTVIVIVILGLIIWAVNKNPATQVGQNEPIKIGAVLSLSGDAAQDGESIKNGLELAKTDLKNRGVDVEIVYQDDKTDGKDTVSAINALSAQKVQALIGPTWSFLADAGVPAADRLNLVALMPANTSEYVSARSPYAFFATTRVEHVTPSLTQWLKDNNKKSIAIIRNQGAWYETVGKAVEQAAAAAGAKIVLLETTAFGEEAGALPTILTKVKAAHADLLFAEIDSDKGIVVMLKKLQELQIPSDVMSVTTSVGRVLGGDAASFTGNNKFFVIAPKSSKEFGDKYNAAYGKMPQAYADRAYDSLMLLVDAIQKRGSTPLQTYLRDTTNYQGFAGTYDFDAVGDILGGEWVIQKIK